jgi:predicted Zn-dependent protease with MMP-like domain
LLKAVRQNFSMNLTWERHSRIAQLVIEETLAALPEPLRHRAEKLPVLFESQPNAELQTDGIGGDTLGLFTGAEYIEQNEALMPPQIILFLENIWNVAGADEEIFREEVQTTFLHELGHYLGLDEGGLIERGLE